MATIKLKVSPKIGNPTVGDVMIPAGKTQTDADLDLRDRLAELVTKGNTLSPDDKAAIYGGLTSMLGKDKAQKIMTHAYIFNARPEIQKLGLDDKLRSFYTVGSNDPDVQAVLGKTKNLGYGVVPGFNRSSSSLNQEIQGQIQPQTITALNPEVQKKVLLRVSK